METANSWPSQVVEKIGIAATASSSHKEFLPEEHSAFSQDKTLPLMTLIQRISTDTIYKKDAAGDPPAAAV